MTLVRPRFVRQYRCAADIFLMDQYPLPSQPLTWLSDSLDQARSLAGEDRVWAVVQAFGGAGSADGGWPRMPHPRGDTRPDLFVFGARSQGDYVLRLPACFARAVLEFSQTTGVSNQFHPSLAARRAKAPQNHRPNAHALPNRLFGPTGGARGSLAQKPKNPADRGQCAAPPGAGRNKMPLSAGKYGPRALEPGQAGRI